MKYATGIIKKGTKVFNKRSLYNSKKIVQLENELKGMEIKKGSN